MVDRFKNKDLLESFPILSNNCREIGKMRTGIEIVNPYIEDMKFDLTGFCLQFPVVISYLFELAITYFNVYTKQELIV